MINDCIIMAGGLGTRLWPASTSSKPKQFLNLPAGGNSNASFFFSAIERALVVIADTGDGHVIIIAGKNHIHAIVEECAKLDAQRRKRLILIPEPKSKNTAPAIACALLYINWISAGRERNILVLTSDHIIHPLEKFKTDVAAAAAMAQADKLVVFGIHPRGPETSYGYIETAGVLIIPPEKNHKSKNKYEPEIFAVSSFREGPDIQSARHFFKVKKFYWNLGMFAFSSKFMLAEFRRCSPEVITPFRKLMAPSEHSYHIRKGIKVLEKWTNIETAYKDTREISFEYAIAEKCPSTVMVKAGFSWINVGNWDEYVQLMKHTGSGKLKASADSEVYCTEGALNTCFVESDIPIALCAVEDLIVVARSGENGGDPVVLISKKGETQRVREIVEKIKKAGRTELL
ncbi:MAG: mannose-1-phosphate guanylyltransferase [Treponema sp.]|jgi:mannose-1-phosphate guanylyltransferase/mannose-1-phosphate guanylyltransferase/mannose-6-phosphate isomerase|nr:mannose-1-phosphate guanylyltransferase [Treponema sp.]